MVGAVVVEGEGAGEGRDWASWVRVSMSTEVEYIFISLQKRRGKKKRRGVGGQEERKKESKKGFKG